MADQTEQQRRNISLILGFGISTVLSVIIAPILRIFFFRKSDIIWLITIGIGLLGVFTFCSLLFIKSEDYRKIARNVSTVCFFISVIGSLFIFSFLNQSSLNSISYSLTEQYTIDDSTIQSLRNTISFEFTEVISQQGTQNSQISQALTNTAGDLTPTPTGQILMSDDFNGFTINPLMWKTDNNGGALSLINSSLSMKFPQDTLAIDRQLSIYPIIPIDYKIVKIEMTYLITNISEGSGGLGFFVNCNDGIIQFYNHKTDATFYTNTIGDPFLFPFYSLPINATMGIEFIDGGNSLILKLKNNDTGIEKTVPKTLICSPINVKIIFYTHNSAFALAKIDNVDIYIQPIKK